MFALILLVLLFSRRCYWGGYGYPYGGYRYGYGAYGYPGYGYQYGAYSPYNPYARPPYYGYANYGYYRPHRWWW